MYFAGLNINHNNGLEGLVWLSTAGGLGYQLYKARLVAKLASAKGGKLKTKRIGNFATVSTIIHSTAFFAPLIAYIVSTALNAFEQPDWLTEFALPDDNVSIRDKANARTIAAVAFIGLSKLAASAYDHLGAQWAGIGVRENGRVVASGPYRYIRHPMYASVLGMQLASAVMFWNKIPLYACAISAVAFAIKMPIEEKIIKSDTEVGLEYKQYKHHVRSRIIPYIW